jgi:hypothetical protein
MEKIYSIDEILLAINEIHIKKKEKKIVTSKNTKIKKNFSAVPKNNLKII